MWLAELTHLVPLLIGRNINKIGLQFFRKSQVEHLYEFWDFNGGAIEEYALLGCNAVNR